MKLAQTPLRDPSPRLDASDQRVVLTLDAGGTNFAFSALKGGEATGNSCVLPSCGSDLDASLDNLISGFEQVIQSLTDQPAAISFAFPGPADYPNGVVFNVGNLPAYSDGVAVAPFLEDHFKLPTFLNNDGDLFAFGESVAGLLPMVNARLAASGSSRRSRNLIAVTLGTGLGGGVVINGRMLTGDNSNAAEIWRLPSGLSDTVLAEEDASIRAVRTVYAEANNTDKSEAPSPADISKIASGELPGDQRSARLAYEKLGQAVGASIATATCLLDGIVVLGGGLSGAADLFMPTLLETLRKPLCSRDGNALPRVPHEIFDLRTEEGLDSFASNASRRVKLPRSSRTIECYSEPRLGIGVTKLGTNLATAIGAYAYAIQQLDKT